MRKIEEIERNIANHLVAIRKLCNEGGFSDYFSIAIVSGRISYNNQYWKLGPDRKLNGWIQSDREEEK